MPRFMSPNRDQTNPHMAMAIAMRIVAWMFFRHRGHEATQGPLLGVYYMHVKHPPKSRCVFRSGHENTTKMTAHSRATTPPDLAGDLTAQFAIGLLFSAFCTPLGCWLLLAI
jgi:hypothetical protein